jgi:hypothetical protein
MAKARCRGIERAATRTAAEKESTTPTLAKVRSIPEATPKSLPGAIFMTAELLAGTNPPAPGVAENASAKWSTGPCPSYPSGTNRS